MLTASRISVSRYSSKLENISFQNVKKRSLVGRTTRGSPQLSWGASDFFSYSHVGENSVMALRMLRHCTKTRVAALRALSVRDEARSAAKLSGSQLSGNLERLVQEVKGYSNSGHDMIGHVMSAIDRNLPLVETTKESILYCMGYNPHPAICEMCKLPSRQSSLTKTKEEGQAFRMCGMKPRWVVVVTSLPQAPATPASAGFY
jgi:hypothetical protein